MAWKEILRKRALKNTSSKLTTSVYDVLQYPVNSEKAVNDSSLKNSYHFVVDKRSSKIDIKHAVATIYGVTVKAVKTSNLPHKWRANRKTVRKPYKKAIVTLKQGDSIVFGE